MEKQIVVVNRAVNSSGLWWSCQPTTETKTEVVPMVIGRRDYDGYVRQSDLGVGRDLGRVSGYGFEGWV